jgi:hypothetical protein
VSKLRKEWEGLTFTSTEGQIDGRLTLTLECTPPYRHPLAEPTLARVQPLVTVEGRVGVVERSILDDCPLGVVESRLNLGQTVGVDPIGERRELEGFVDGRVEVGDECAECSEGVVGLEADLDAVPLDGTNAIGGEDGECRRGGREEVSGEREGGAMDRGVPDEVGSSDEDRLVRSVRVEVGVGRLGRGDYGRPESSCSLRVGIDDEVGRREGEGGDSFDRNGDGKSRSTLDGRRRLGERSWSRRGRLGCTLVKRGRRRVVDVGVEEEDVARANLASESGHPSSDRSRQHRGLRRDSQYGSRGVEELGSATVRQVRRDHFGLTASELDRAALLGRQLDSSLGSLDLEIELDMLPRSITRQRRLTLGREGRTATTSWSA